MIGAYSVDLAQKIKKQSAGKMNMFLMVNVPLVQFTGKFRYFSVNWEPPGKIWNVSKVDFRKFLCDFRLPDRLRREWLSFVFNAIAALLGRSGRVLRRREARGRHCAQRYPFLLPVFQLHGDQESSATSSQMARYYILFIVRMLLLYDTFVWQVT